MDRSSQDLELYTIPSYSSWFSWNNIHEVERFSLREFFDGSSVTRSPRIYKEYRDFIISKYREDPSRKLTFTEVRKSLVGDISVLLKVFTFLEKWGLINFNVADNSEKNSYEGSARTASFGVEEEEDNWRGRVKVEEGAPYGVRVVAAPNSMKPIIAPPPPPSVAVDGGGFVGEVGESGFKWPPLASYSDVYGELMQQEKKKALVCGSCKENCDSAHYQYTKEGSFVLCEKCFKSGNYDKNKLADDFKYKDSANQAAAWTDAETLLLLESVLKHGDDWDLVAKNVQTKSKLECIAKLIELPFGDLMLGAGNRKSRYLDVIGDITNSRQSGLASNESQESVKAEDPGPEVKDKEQSRELTDTDQSPELKDNDNSAEHKDEDLSPELKDEDQQKGDAKNEGPPLKRLRTGPTSDVGNSLMKQVARISTMLGPHVTASAADAAVTALCYENQCSREIFDDDDNYVDSKASPETSDQRRVAEVDNSVEEEEPNQSEIQGISCVKSIIPQNLRTRAATATALGAAAANAKLLADQEEREIGQLVATMIEAQLTKLQRKLKYFDDLEQIMGKEHAQLEELEESLIAERINVLQRIFSAGITKPKEQTSTMHQTDVVQ
ncbi:SWI/SNF complex subunit SWI3A [Sesamum indicum]|uniref:SWI/SNF complex subunit SWI3A n=1 Tax=Sesamum indicum TaxID=4182 RepID=A0A6I9SST9_SESIN|nr:SWI/SNF complex subunit SWI3A [Sesamum indicum]